MKNKLEKLVEKTLIKHFLPLVEKMLLEGDTSMGGTQVSQMYIPSMTMSLTAAGQTLRPNARPDTNPTIKKKDIFRVIKTTPLVLNLVQWGLLDPQALGLPAQGDEQEPQEGEEENENESQQEDE
jgi:hypothetical protein